MQSTLKKKLEIFLIILLAIGIGFLLRTRIHETYDAWQRARIQGSLPQAQNYETIQQLHNKNEATKNTNAEVQAEERTAQTNENQNLSANITANENTASSNVKNTQQETSQNTNVSKSEERQTQTQDTQARKVQKLPEAVNLAVPFTPQAPYANWDLPYQEACEEASALMAHAYYANIKLDPARADKEIAEIVSFQEQHYGFYKDTTAEETTRFMRDKWGYKNVRVETASVEMIKTALAQGYPVLAPAAGRMLGNPYFRGEGPLYHMLVIRGYTKDGKFITNDPGTKRGEGYVYTESTLMNAIHDWNNGNVANGEKRVIIVEPN